MANRKYLYLNGSSDTVRCDLERTSNVVIEGSFGGGTVTHTLTGTSLEIRTPTTVTDAYASEVWDSTFTLTGGTGAAIVITIECT